MKTYIVLVIALCGGLSCGSPPPEPQYFSCEGESGIADNQEPLSPLSREITSSKGPIKGSVRIDDKNVVVDGIPFLADIYLICRTNDQSLLFSLLPHYHDGPKGIEPAACSENEKVGCGGPESPCFELGMFNKLTGDFRYHVDNVIYTMSCRKTTKLVK